MTFDYEVPSSEHYEVQIILNSDTLKCEFSNNTQITEGTISDQNVTLAITCASSYAVSINITGDTPRPGNIIVEMNTRGDDGRGDVRIIYVGVTTFAFRDRLLQGQDYRVSVTTQPTGMTCTVDGGTDWRTMGSADVTIDLNCTNNTP